jgi:pimeloyl-ACP methyl ester carboxylesterase
VALTRRVLLVLASAVVVLAVYVAVQFRADMKVARAAVASYEPIAVDTSFGSSELVDVGSGFPVLSIHGTGGGFDQGLALADGLLDAGYRVIAPSRFGYLGAPIPERTDALAQADAFAELLDQLAVDRAIVTGASAGAITALAFADRYPERTASLLLMVPDCYPPEQAAPEPWSPIRTWAVTTALRSDFLFWAGMRLFPTGMLTTVLATDSDLIEAANPEERARLDAVLAMILPISARADGLLLDAQNTASPPEIGLIASAEDDHYRTADSARLLAGGIAGRNSSSRRTAAMSGPTGRRRSKPLRQHSLAKSYAENELGRGRCARGIRIATPRWVYRRCQKSMSEAMPGALTAAFFLGSSVGICLRLLRTVQSMPRWNLIMAFCTKQKSIATVI